MRHRAPVLLLPALVLTVGCLARGQSEPWQPAANAEEWAVGPYQPGTHAHNDYEQDRPLRDALAHGFASIEVDVFWIDGAFLVAHDEEDVVPGKTIQSMYLDPLRALAADRGGRIYPAPASPLQLLIDLKTDGYESYEALETALAEYDELFTVWEGGRTREGPIVAVVSGDRPFSDIRDADVRRTALDGRIYDPRHGIPASTMPIVSINWDDTEDAKDRMAAARAMIEQVQGEGRTIRFWNTGDRAESWAWLSALGVDYIGTDDIPALTRFLSDARGR